MSGGNKRPHILKQYPCLSLCSFLLPPGIKGLIKTQPAFICSKPTKKTPGQ